MTTTAPAVRVGRGWISLLSLANLGLWMGYFGPLQVLLPNQAEAVAGDDKTTVLAVVTGLGALVAVLTGPIAGALSDITTARTGRRHTWIVAGALLGAAGLAVLAGQRTVLGLVLGWCLAQAGLNALQAGLTAVVPDRTPVNQRGLVSGWIGMPQALGLVIGSILVTAIFTETSTGYLVLALGLVLLAAPFALLTEDQPLPPGTLAKVRWKIDLKGNPDFAWAFGTRFLVQLGNALGTLYLLYFLTDAVKLDDPEGGLLIMILLYTVGMIATAMLGGWLSDRIGRRKPFVIWSGVLITIAATLLAFWPTWPMAIVAATLFGAGYGVYLAVDTALITQVLPAAADRAKDLGVINIATAAPQVLGPAISAPIVTHLGGYPALFALTAIVTLAGAVAVVKIRSVR